MPTSATALCSGTWTNSDRYNTQDLLLPRSMISRLSRGVLPPNTQIQKDALLALTRSATVFISYLASHANEQSQLRHRKTLGVQDVYAALHEIEFANVMQLGAVGADGRTGGRLEREVEMFEELAAKKRKGYRDKVKARESGGAGDDEDGGEPNSKKARRSLKEEGQDGDDDDEEERMLEQQLNGTATGGMHPESSLVPQQNGQSDGVSVVVPGSAGKGKAKATLSKHDDEDEDEAENEAEDDPADDDDDDDDDEDDDEDQGGEDEDDVDEDDEADEATNTDIDDSRRVNGRSHGLLPNGEVELGSDEESD
jgi:DNA polymerase epsilon subunit 3